MANVKKKKIIIDCYISIHSLFTGIYFSFFYIFMQNDNASTMIDYDWYNSTIFFFSSRTQLLRSLLFCCIQPSLKPMIIVHCSRSPLLVVNSFTLHYSFLSSSCLLLLLINAHFSSLCFNIKSAFCNKTQKKKTKERSTHSITSRQTIECCRM